MTKSSPGSPTQRRNGTTRTSQHVRSSALLLVAAMVLSLVVTAGPPEVAEAQAPAVIPHLFQADADGLIPNRRPANLGFLGVSDGVIRVEDTREATAGAEHGYVVPPDPNTMQQVIRQASWPTAEGEVIDTAVGFLTNYSSPELVVLRGSSGRWTDRDPTVPTSLTWYGRQQDGFEQATEIALDGLGEGESPVGVEIVNNADDTQYLLLATDRALYAFTGVGSSPDETHIVQRFVKRYGPNDRILGIHHAPQWAASPTEQFQLPALQSAVVGVLLSSTTNQFLSVDLARVYFEGPGGFASFGQVFPITSRDLTDLGNLPAQTYTGVATGGDIRYSIAQTRARNDLQLPCGVADCAHSQEVRVDVNLTTSDQGVRSTQQWSGRTSRQGEAGDGPDAFPITVLRKVAAPSSTCGDLVTGFDATYFRASQRDHTTDADEFPTEAHVMCASSGSGGSVVVGGYDEVLAAGIRPIPEVTVGSSSGGAFVQPQISLSFPCLEQLRYVLRLQNPMQRGGSSPSSILSSLRSDAAFMRNTSGWRDTYSCSAMPSPDIAEFININTHISAGNVQATISAALAPSGAGPLGPRSTATGAEIVSRSLEVPRGIPRIGGLGADYPPTSWREHDARTVLPTAEGSPAGMSPGIFLNRLPSTDVAELVRLTGQSASCGRYPPTAGQAKGDQLSGPPCNPREVRGGPVPIAVMAAPPFVKGTDQAAQITPEFANGTSATQEVSEFTSSSVGASVELKLGAGVSTPVVSSEVSATVGVGYDRETEASTSTAFTVGKALGYGGALTNDTIVTNNVRYRAYSGTVVEDSVGIATGSETVLRVPVGNVVTSQSLPDLLTDKDAAGWWKGDGPFGAGLRGILSHVPGLPGTYLGGSSDPDAELSAYCIGDLDPRQGVPEVRKGSPAAANPFLGARKDLDTLPQILTGGWGAATAGDDVTTQRSNIEFGQEFSDSFLESNTISASVSLEAEYEGFGITAGVKGTVSAAGTWGNSYSASLGTNTTFSGSVGSIPDADLKDEEFGWRMFVCKREIAPGLPVWVQGYQVREYDGLYQERGPSSPEDLGPIEMEGPRRSAEVSTTPELRWKQPVGTVSHYGLEVEAVGKADVRDFTAPAVDSSGTVLEGWPALADRTSEASFTVPGDQALLPDQLYRWRVISNNPFFKTETSSWEYFVTQSQAPTASDQTVSTSVDTPKAITLTGGDPEGGPLTFAVATQPVHGTLTGTPPLLTYTPEAGYTGADSFTFTASDGGQSATGTVTIAVDPAPPVEDGWLPFASWDDATVKLHQWVLGRPPTPVEQALWVERFTVGTQTLPDLVVALRSSPDNVDVVDPVVRLYSAYFLRIPDRDGIRYWTDRLRRGTSLKYVADFFAASREFQQRYGSLSDRQFVERIYQNILGRPGEQIGVDFWTEQLSSGRRSRGWVMIGFSESPEYQDAQRANVNAAALWILLGDLTPSVAQRDELAQAFRAGIPPTLVARDLLRDPAVAAHATR